jgi:hypothetical protein
MGQRWGRPDGSIVGTIGRHTVTSRHRRSAQVLEGNPPRLYRESSRRRSCEEAPPVGNAADSSVIGRSERIVISRRHVGKALSHAATTPLQVPYGRARVAIRQHPLGRTVCLPLKEALARGRRLTTKHSSGTEACPRLRSGASLRTPSLPRVIAPSVK